MTKRRTLSNRIIELEAALREIDELAVAAQQDWYGVNIPYAPEWTLGYKDILDVIDRYIDEDEEPTS